MKNLGSCEQIFWPFAGVSTRAASIPSIADRSARQELATLRIDTNAQSLVTEEEINASLEEGVDAG